MLKRVAAVLLVRVYQRVSLRQNLRRRMVVGYDNIQPRRRTGNFLNGADAAVHSNNQRRTISVQRVKRFNIQPVALAFALRYVSVHIRAAVLQKQIQQRAGADAVHIVIAINGNALFALNSLPDALHRFCHVLHQKRVMEGLIAAVQKFVRSSGSCNAAVQQNPRHQRRYTCFRTKAFGFFFIKFVKLPDFVFLH